MRTSLLILLAALTMFTACGESPNGTAASQETHRVEPVEEKLSPLPEEIGRRLVSETNHIDYLFNDMDFTMSLDEPQAILYALNGIAAEAPAKRQGCMPIGQVIYQGHGEIIVQANLYFSTGCVFFEFLDEKGKPQYANELTELGRNFFNRQFSQLLKNYEPVE